MISAGRPAIDPVENDASLLISDRWLMTVRNKGETEDYDGQARSLQSEAAPPVLLLVALTADRGPARRSLWEELVLPSLHSRQPLEIAHQKPGNGPSVFLV